MARFLNIFIYIVFCQQKILWIFCNGHKKGLWIPFISFPVKIQHLGYGEKLVLRGRLQVDLPGWGLRKKSRTLVSWMTFWHLIGSTQGCVEAQRESHCGLYHVSEPESGVFSSSLSLSPLRRFQEQPCSSNFIILKSSNGSKQCQSLGENEVFVQFTTVHISWFQCPHDRETNTQRNEVRRLRSFSVHAVYDGIRMWILSLSVWSSFPLTMLLSPTEFSNL